MVRPRVSIRIKPGTPRSMLKIYDRYLIKQMMISTLVVAGGLSMVILLTQSLRFIELVMDSNASAESFFTLVALSLPRFFEAVMPASVLISTLFVFNRLAMDSEMIVLKASGASPFRLARPVLTGGLALTAGLLVLSLWISPIGIAHMQTLRKEIKAQYAHLLFREGVFNTIGANMTAYVRQSAADGRLVGLMLEDTRALRNGGPVVTIVARSGHLISEKDGQKIVVYDGSRQERDPETGKFSRLDFKQYTLDIPASSDPISERWREPDERTINQLMSKEETANDRPDQRIQFRAEINRRFSTPLLMLSFALIAATALLTGPFTRSGQMPLVGIAAIVALGQQGLYLIIYNHAKHSLAACIGLYGVALVPAFLALFFLSRPGEKILAQLGRILRNIIHKGT